MLSLNGIQRRFQTFQGDVPAPGSRWGWWSSTGQTVPRSLEVFWYVRAQEQALSTPTTGILFFAPHGGAHGSLPFTLPWACASGDHPSPRQGTRRLSSRRSKQERSMSRADYDEETGADGEPRCGRRPSSAGDGPAGGECDPSQVRLGGDVAVASFPSLEEGGRAWTAPRGRPSPATVARDDSSSRFQPTEPPLSDRCTRPPSSVETLAVREEDEQQDDERSKTDPQQQRLRQIAPGRPEELGSLSRPGTSSPSSPSSQPPCTFGAPSVGDVEAVLRNGAWTMRRDGRTYLWCECHRRWGGHAAAECHLTSATTERGNPPPAGRPAEGEGGVPSAPAPQALPPPPAHSAKTREGAGASNSNKQDGKGGSDARRLNQRSEAASSATSNPSSVDRPAEQRSPCRAVAVTPVDAQNLSFSQKTTTSSTESVPSVGRAEPRFRIRPMDVASVDAPYFSPSSASEKSPGASRTCRLQVWHPQRPHSRIARKVGGVWHRTGPNGEQFTWCEHHEAWCYHTSDECRGRRRRRGSAASYASGERPTTTKRRPSTVGAYAGVEYRVAAAPVAKRQKTDSPSRTRQSGSTTAEWTTKPPNSNQRDKVVYEVRMKVRPKGGVFRWCRHHRLWCGHSTATCSPLNKMAEVSACSDGLPASDAVNSELRAKRVPTTRAAKLFTTIVVPTASRMFTAASPHTVCDPIDSTGTLKDVNAVDDLLQDLGSDSEEKFVDFLQWKEQQQLKLGTEF